ncbi:MAG: glycerol-3-phosphate acyltransferase [Dehalococcoidales bacterium]|nr:glycerol-3-phosphate acyltransferase [Dehalococcoidales bacterium]
MLLNIIFIIISYFIGAFPQLYLLCKLHKLNTTGDLHMNLWQGAGPAWGLFGISIDVLKGALAIWIAKALGLDLSIIVACGLAAVAGQMWPVFSKFDGEKGNTTGLGMSLALAYQSLLIALIPVLFGLISKLVKLLNIKGQSMGKSFRTGAGQSNALPIGVIIGFLILPIASFLLGKPIEIVIGFTVLLVLIIIRRLTAGLNEDLKNKLSLRTVLFNRIIYDRSRR